VTQGLEFDRVYCFKVRALNIYGWGEWSIVSYISTSDNPGQMEVLMTESIYDPIDEIQKVRFSWIEPLANGEFITKYQIKFMRNDGLGNNYLEELVNCDGSDIQVITNMYCDVPTTVFRAEPFAYRRGVLIRAIARAYNLFEWGQWS
jgi:hypothetical protein